MLAQWLEPDVDHAGRDQREEQVAASPEDGPEPADDKDIDPDNTGAQCEVGEGTVDDDVDVPQAVAQDSDTHRDRDQGATQRQDRAGDHVRLSPGCTDDKVSHISENHHRHRDDDPQVLLARRATRGTKARQQQPD